MTTLEGYTTAKTGQLEPWGTVATTKATAAWLMRYASPHTRRAYERSRVQFVAFCTDHGIDRPEQVSRGVVDAWVRLMTEAGRSPNTISARVAAISSWMDALVDAGIIPANTTHGVRRPPREREGTTPCPGTDVLRLVLADIAARRSPDVALAIELMARYAFRVSTIVALRRQDVVIDSNGTTLLRAFVKGGRRVPVRLSPDLATRIRALPVRPGDVLFVAPGGGPFTVDTVRHALVSASKHAHLPRPLSAHQLRTWAINAALDAGMGIDDVASFAMHSKVDTTRGYDRRRRRRADEVAEMVARALNPERGASTP